MVCGMVWCDGGVVEGQEKKCESGKSESFAKKWEEIGELHHSHIIFFYVASFFLCPR